MRFLRESAVHEVLTGRHDAARDQQGDVRRVTMAATRGLRSWFTSPPPDVAVEITARGVDGRGARGGLRSRRCWRSTRRRRWPQGPSSRP